MKPIALLALPVVGIIWAGENRTLRSTIKYWVASFALSAAVLGVLGWITNVGFGWIFTLATPGTVQHWYAPVSIVTGAFGGTLDALGLDSTMTVEVIKLMALGLMVVFVAWIMFTMRKIDPLVRLALAFAAAVLSSTVIHPWYAAWVIVLFALVGLKEGIQTHLVVAGSIFFASLSIAETMDIPDAVQGDVVSQIIRNVIISAGAVALIFAYCLHEDLSLPRFLKRFRDLWRERMDARAALRAKSSPSFGVSRVRLETQLCHPIRQKRRARLVVGEVALDDHPVRAFEQTVGGPHIDVRHVVTCGREGNRPSCSRFASRRPTATRAEPRRARRNS